VYLVLREKGCPACGGPVNRTAVTQLPLLMHAGYGEAQRHEHEWCTTVGCGRVREVAVSALNPRTALRREAHG